MSNPTPPPALNYQSPDTFNTPERKLFFRHALGGGIVAILLALCIGGFTFSVISRVTSASNLATYFALGMSLYSLYFLVAGVIYIFAAIGSKKPASPWLHLARIVATIHAVLILIFLCILAISSTRTPSGASGLVVPFLFNLALIYAFAKIATLAKTLITQESQSRLPSAPSP